MKNAVPYRPSQLKISLFLFFALLLLLLSLVSSLVYYIPPDYTIFFHLLGLCMPGLVFFNLLLFIVGFFRGIRYSIIGGLALLGCWHYLSNVLQFNSSSADAVEDIRIGTYNIRGFKMQYGIPSTEHIADFVADNSINVLCLQEVPAGYSPQQLKEHFPQLPYQTLTTDSVGGHHLAILSKFPIAEAETVSFPNRPNALLQADIVLDQQTVKVLNCHLQTTGWNQVRGQGSLALNSVFDGVEAEAENVVYRGQQASQISQIVAGSAYPTIVCGDFNTQPVSYCYHTAKSDLKDAFCEAGQGYSYTYQYFKKLYRIDFVLFSDTALQALRYRTENLPYSDHLPVIVDFKLI